MTVEAVISFNDHQSFYNIMNSIKEQAKFKTLGAAGAL